MSSSDLAISVRGLCKSYTIGIEKEKHSTLAETLLASARAAFRRSTTRTFNALDDVSFDIKRGEVVGIVGRNGAGKSTLLKVLSRITEPTKGEIVLYGRVGSLLEVGTGFHPELTGRENIYLNGAILGMTKLEIRREFDAIVSFAGVAAFLDTPVKRYSSGMYVRLAFAVAAHLRSEILIIDEVLAVGDADFQQKCLGKMKDVSSEGRTVLFVSHNMAAVRELCASGIYLEKGKALLKDTAHNIIKTYLSIGAENELHIEDGPLRSIKVFQEAASIVLIAVWDYPEGLRLPNLGFVIHDVFGVPVSGTNPHLCGLPYSPTVQYAGRVTVKISEPRLLDGRYYLSIWFGDGAHDFVELPKCMSLEIRGMAGRRQHSSPSLVGPVAPACNFSFEANP